VLGARARPALAEALLPALGGHGALIDLFVRALVPAPPTERAQGGFIAEGYDAALDELRRPPAIRAAPSPRSKRNTATRPAFPR
jgi:DNA mismatch repair protein MutS